ncbi:DUF1837 domain-containing protein [Pseudoalteromonas sp. C2R02]|uniref:Hachiman antiphage defense system protein HamA n=1 Tax=Pseudoalteromonas sp. C2R02 TaxID=2841565 RepID=UPI001C085494|nr:Hachiman antiphage defense system protein HamA [Pseudoalteromonas sp. C2R02]MBU2968259.1 DUF1837 domain-containing protein [Pseudoalteromonas sp. C2R02]
MNIDIAEQLSVKVKCDGKNSSGTIYINGENIYIFTAKHSICPKSPEECQSQRIKRECNSCELSNSYKAQVTKINVSNVGANNREIKPKKVIAHKDKDLALLVLKAKDYSFVRDLPEVKICNFDDITDSDKFVTCGFPVVTGNNEYQPIHYTDMAKLGRGLNFQIEGSVNSNLESTKDNLAGNSGSGIIKKHLNKNLLVGIYTKTGDISASYGEYIDHTVNELLESESMPLLVFENEVSEISTLIKDDFLKCFTEIKHDLALGKQRELNLFTIKLDGKKIDYDNLKERLDECIKLFTLPRKLIKQYEEQNKNKKADRHGNKIFLELNGKNKVAELLLQGFLESHLNAPKLYSFIDSHNQNIQSVHIKLNDTKLCELVYSTAKMGQCLQTTLCNTLNGLLQAIPNLSGVDSLLSNHLFDSTFDNKEQKILSKLLLPTEDDKPNNISNSFSLFIGFDFKCSNAILYKNTPEFNKLFQNEIIEKIQIVLSNIRNLLDEFNIVNSELNCYIVPFNDTQEFCQSFLKDI